ncbi:MAG: IS66 family transposase [Lachnospiraceae bacterium]|nr:IS66 family transposase [Lachnospiraceae bacterium]
MKKTDNNQTSNAEMVTISRAEYEEFQAQRKKISELESRVDILMEALRLARHKQFGASSEKSEDSLMEQLSFLFNEAEVFSAAEKEAERNVTVVAAHQRHKKHEYTLDNIPEGIETRQVEHRLEGEDLVCPQCGDTMTEIGKEVVRTLEIIPAQMVVREDIYYTYACRTCNRVDIETPVVKAPREKNIIPGSFATPEAIAHIMTQKFVMGSPLYRQEQEINRRGIHLSRQTMSNWILKATEDYLAPVYEQLHKELLKRDVLHADETTLQVLHEPGKKPQSDSYMWLYRTSGDTDKPIVLYEYQPGRGAKHPKEFLAGYKGYLHTDGYAGYHDLGKDITVVGCWAHTRRKFDEAVKSLPKGKVKGSSASQGLTYCNLLFGIEQEIAGKTAEQRYEERLKQAKPVLDAMFAWANSRTAAPKSALGKAFHYLKEQWPYLTNYLKDGRLEISNNRAERSIKPFVIDRKNFLFANTLKGAAGSAVMFSLIQTAIENGLDPYKYLTWLLKTAKNADLADTQVVQSLLPWNVPKVYRTK